jgi:hypothetical protein
MNIYVKLFSGKMILEKGKVVSTPFSEGVQLLFKISNSLKQHENKQEVISDLLNMDIPSKKLLQLEI